MKEKQHEWMEYQLHMCNGLPSVCNWALEHGFVFRKAWYSGPGSVGPLDKYKLSRSLKIIVAENQLPLDMEIELTVTLDITSHPEELDQSVIGKPRLDYAEAMPVKIDNLEPKAWFMRALNLLELDERVDQYFPAKAPTPEEACYRLMKKVCMMEDACRDVCRADRRRLGGISEANQEFGRAKAEAVKVYRDRLADFLKECKWA